MGLLMFLGMIGSVAYSGYAIKNEYDAMATDSKIKINKPNNNKETIERNFTSILKRCRIKYDKATGNPTEEHYSTAVDYLKFKGYQEEDIEFFKELFQEKLKEYQNTHTNSIEQYHNNVIKDINDSEKLYYHTFTIKNYGRRNTKEKMEKMMQNRVWNKLVDNYTCIDGTPSIEVWNLYVPLRYTRNKLIRKIYFQVCEMEELTG